VQSREQFQETKRKEITEQRFERTENRKMERE